MYNLYIKRFFDILCSILGLVILSPLLLAIAILVWVKLGPPAVFSHERPGLKCKIFKLYKFRSMLDTRDEHGQLLPDGERLTPFGKKLRSTSLDELPELWNILKGEMSIVGPRPLLVQYLPLYSVEQMQRHTVRPGLTGYAQINGRNDITWQEKFELDCWYIDNQSIWLDIKIVFETIARVFSRKGISSATSPTMEFFTGNDVIEEEEEFDG